MEAACKLNTKLTIHPFAFRLEYNCWFWIPEYRWILKSSMVFMIHLFYMNIKTHYPVWSPNIVERTHTLLAEWSPGGRWQSKNLLSNKKVASDLCQRCRQIWSGHSWEKKIPSCPRCSTRSRWAYYSKFRVSLPDKQWISWQRICNILVLDKFEYIVFILASFPEKEIIEVQGSSTSQLN